MTWNLALGVFCVVAAVFLVIMALLIRNFLMVSPAQIQRAFNQLRTEVDTAVQGLARQWSDTLEQLTDQADRVAKERQKTQMERGRAEKAAQQQMQLDPEVPDVDPITAARRKMRAQGYSIR